MRASGPRIFVSYARSDGKASAKRLSERLRTEGFSLWRDLADMEGGRDWWQQIEEAIRAVEYLILVITKAALCSEYVRKEWRFARQEGRCVIPILADKDLTGSVAFRALPGWMQRAHFVDADDPEQMTRLVRTLEKPCEVRRVPFMAGDRPAGYVERPREMEALIGHMVHGETHEPVAITVVLQGAGGFGKTALALALCHDPRIEESFDDGILWVTLREHPGDLKGRIGDLIFVLVGTRPAFDQLPTATAELANVLGERRVLVVVDDAWDAAHLEPFLQGGHHCARLVTTRNRSIVPTLAETVAVDCAATRRGDGPAWRRPPGGVTALGVLSRPATRLGKGLCSGSWDGTLWRCGPDERHKPSLRGHDNDAEVTALASAARRAAPSPALGPHSAAVGPASGTSRSLWDLSGTSRVFTGHTSRRRQLAVSRTAAPSSGSSDSTCGSGISTASAESFSLLPAPHRPGHEDGCAA